MPNWVYTEIYVTGDPEEIARFKKDASALNQKNENEMETWSLFRSLDPVEGDAGEQLHHWGVRTGDCFTTLEDEAPDMLLFMMMFPWSFPQGGLEHISAKYPDLKFEVSADEESCEFQIEAEFKGGKMILFSNRYPASD